MLRYGNSQHAKFVLDPKKEKEKRQQLWPNCCRW